MHTCGREWCWSVSSLWRSLVLFLLYINLQILSGKIIMWLYSRFLCISSYRWPTCGSSTFKDSFPVLKTRSFPEVYLLIRPLRRPLAFDRGRIHSVLLYASPLRRCLLALSLTRSYRWDFSFTEDETRRHFSNFSGTFREDVWSRVIYFTQGIGL